MKPLSEAVLREEFILASGPGGQKVNKTSTAVRLRIWVADLELPLVVRDRLVRLAGGQITREGELIIEASEERSQERNREAARSRLAKLVDQAHRIPRKRRATKPSRASKERRLDSKKRRSRTKAMRGRVD